MAGDWKQNKSWSDKFVPQLKAIAGLVVVGYATLEDDCERCTDLVSLRVESHRLACRVRRHCYRASYADEFTIRAFHPRGESIKVELAKILEGWARYLIYGFASEDESHIAWWQVGDLNAFRLWFHRESLKGKCPGVRCDNKDGSSAFLSFKWSSVPNFVVATPETHGIVTVG